MIYEIKRHVTFNDIDATGDLKLGSILKYMAEASWKNAEDLGAGIDFTMEIGLAFIIQRTGIRIFKAPQLGDELTVRTWPAQLTRSAFKRNGDISDAEGNKLIEWESLWVLIDINERKIKRPSAFPRQFPVHGQLGVEIEANKIIPSEDMQQIGTLSHTVAFSELDMNAHMNNTVYGDLIMNILSKYDAPTIKNWIDIQFNYNNEAKLADEITLSYTNASNQLYVTGGKAGEKEIFTAEITYKESM